MSKDFGEMSLLERHEALQEEYKAARVVINNLHVAIEDLTEQVGRMVADLDLIRRYSGEYAAGVPPEVRNKYLIGIIPTIVDHALDDMVSGAAEAYEIIKAKACS